MPLQCSALKIIIIGFFIVYIIAIYASRSKRLSILHSQRNENNFIHRNPARTINQTELMDLLLQKQMSAKLHLAIYLFVSAVNFCLFL